MRKNRIHLRVTLLAVLFLFVSSLSYAITEDAALQKCKELSGVRKLLTGSDKKLAEARKELLKLTGNNGSKLSSSVLCMSYIYLGYIDDIEGNRPDALKWYRKATTVGEDKIKHTLSLARSGIRNPLKWIGHLDQGAGRIPSKYTKKTSKSIAGKIGKCVIYTSSQSDYVPKKRLTPEEMEENFRVLSEAIDRYYSFFIYKEVDWKKIRSEYQEKLPKIRSTTQFYKMIYKFVRELDDAHSRLENYKGTPELQVYAPPISFRNIEGKPVVIDVWTKSRAYRDGVRPGWILSKINRKPAVNYLKFLQKHVPVSSSQRNLVDQTTRRILCGKKESWVQLDFIAPQRKLVRGLRMSRSVRYPVTEPKSFVNLTKLKTMKYGKHSGIGYIRIPTFRGQMELADEFDQALEKLRDTQKLLIDIRDNTGGYGTSQKRIIGRLLKVKKPGVISFHRKGPKHDDFTNNAEIIAPYGKWQYTKPVGLLMNSISGSASDLFAARLISAGRVASMGQTTHGNVTGRSVYAVLPCNLVVRISNGYIANASGQIIEGNGNVPETIIEPTIKDAQQSVDGVLERAFKKLANIR
jgi:C-terminal processing protease CtpA/Prc